MKPLEVPAVAALVGAALLLVLFPRTDPSAAFGVPAAGQEIPAEAITAEAVGGIT